MYGFAHHKRLFLLKINSNSLWIRNNFNLIVQINKKKSVWSRNLPVVREGIRITSKLVAAVTRQQLGLKSIQSLRNFLMSALDTENIDKKKIEKWKLHWNFNKFHEWHSQLRSLEGLTYMWYMNYAEIDLQLCPRRHSEWTPSLFP